MAISVVTIGPAHAGQCLAEPPAGGGGGPSSGDFPAELRNFDMTLLFSDDFDDQPDFSNFERSQYCLAGSGTGCGILPDGWSDWQVRERFHPIESGNSSLQSSLQINSNNPRGGTGKSVQIWDESFGDTGSWGSEAVLGKYFPQGYEDIYVEYWIQFQPGYRWHHQDLSNNHGINYAKLLRMTHRDNGGSPFSFFARGDNGPIMLVSAAFWARDESGRRRVRSGAQTQLRCDPQETNYKCDGFETSGSLKGYFPPEIEEFTDSYGDGNWHKLSARMAINSAPGARDGIAMVWFDDVLVGNATDIPYRGSGSPAGTLINQVTIGGNAHNYPEPESNQFEQWYSIDDVKIYSVNRR